MPPPGALHRGDADLPGHRDGSGDTEEQGYLLLSRCPHYERVVCLWVVNPQAQIRPFPCWRCPERCAPYIVVDLATNTVLDQKLNAGTVASALQLGPEACWFYYPYEEFPSVVGSLDVNLIPHVDWGCIRVPVDTFWSRRVHAACRAEDREVILVVLLCARRLAEGAGGVPYEMWDHLLSFLPVVTLQAALAGWGGAPPMRRGAQMQLGPV